MKPTSHRPILSTVITLGIALGLVQATGVFAAGTDTATTGQNHVATGTINPIDPNPPGPTPDLRLGVPDASGDCTGTAGTYGNDLASAVIDVTNVVGGAAAGTSLSSGGLCLGNHSTNPTAVTTWQIIDLVQEDVVCSPGETRCANDYTLAGKLNLNVKLKPGSSATCPASDTTIALNTNFQTTPSPIIGNIPAGAVCAYVVELKVASPLTIEEGQDRVSWRIQFSTDIPQIVATVSTFAGTSLGHLDGPAAQAQFNEPLGVVTDPAGNVIIADYANHRIRKITPAGVVSTIAGTGGPGNVNGAAATAQFNFPFGITMDGSGNLFIGDRYTHSIRKIATDGTVSTIAGNGSPGYANGTGAAASFNWASGVALDSQGNIYVADTQNNRIRKVTQAGVVTTFAGNGSDSFADGTGEAAAISQPQGIASDSAGNLYVADDTHRLRKITPAGVVTTLAGSDTAGFADGTGSAAQFNVLCGVAVNSSGTVFVTDCASQLVRMVTPAGVVSTLAGTANVSGATNGVGTAATFGAPVGIAVGPAGELYTGEYSNHRIRKLVLGTS